MSDDNLDYIISEDPNGEFIHYREESPSSAWHLSGLVYKTKSSYYIFDTRMSFDGGGSRVNIKNLLKRIAHNTTYSPFIYEIDSSIFRDVFSGKRHARCLDNFGHKKKYSMTNFLSTDEIKKLGWLG